MDGGMGTDHFARIGKMVGRDHLPGVRRMVDLVPVLQRGRKTM